MSFGGSQTGVRLRANEAHNLLIVACLVRGLGDIRRLMWVTVLFHLLRV